MRFNRALALIAVVLLAASPALALPPDCSRERCEGNPGLLCAVPGTFRVVQCKDWVDPSDPFTEAESEEQATVVPKEVISSSADVAE